MGRGVTPALSKPDPIVICLIVQNTVPILKLPPSSINWLIVVTTNSLHNTSVEGVVKSSFLCGFVFEFLKLIDK